MGIASKIFFVCSLFAAFAQSFSEPPGSRRDPLCPEKIETSFCDTFMVAEDHDLFRIQVNLKSSRPPSVICDKTEPKCDSSPPYQASSDTLLIRTIKELFSTYDLRSPSDPEVRADVPDTIHSEYLVYAGKETILKFIAESYVVSVDSWVFTGPSSSLPKLGADRIDRSRLKFNIKGRQIREGEKPLLFWLRPLSRD